jgi:hypothetical protein
VSQRMSGRRLRPSAGERHKRWRDRISADLVVVVVLLAALAAFSAYTTARQAEEGAPDYSTHSTAARGAAALYLWLGDLGYRVERIENGPFRVADEARLLLVLAPPEPYSDVETRLLQNWLEEQGHTLVLVADGWRGADLMEAFEVRTALEPDLPAVLTPTVPLLTSPPPGPVETGARSGLAPEGDEFVAHLQSGEAPVLLSRRWGEGRAILATSPAPFTNAGLRDPGSARLVYNLVASLRPGALVQFDEVHHGYRAAVAENSLRAWLFRSPWGWAVLYAATVVLGWIVLRGRRFGRPVPLPERVALRPESEYVVSMAGLFRRAGRRSFAMRHHHDQLKRGLARPWRLNPDLPDRAFVAELARVRDDLDAAALRDLLARLSGERVSEGELVRLVGEVDRWLEAKRNA